MNPIEQHTQIVAQQAAEETISKIKPELAQMIADGIKEAQKQAQGPRLLTVKEVAGLLAVSQRTVHQLVSDGELKPNRVRGALRFSSEEISAYIRG